MSPLIDAHHHVWDPAEADYPWMTDDLSVLRRRFDADDLRRLIGPAGVTGTVLVQTRSSLDETRAFLALAEKTDFILGVVGWVDLTAPDVDAAIGALKAGPGGRFLSGIRHQVHDEADPDWLRRDDVARGLDAVAAHGLAYDLLLRPRELPAAIAAVRRQPDLTWVLDHIAKPGIAQGGWEPWAGGIAELAAASATCRVKLSGMVTEADWAGWSVADLEPYVRHVLDCFGPERTMLGSDWPVCLLAAPYDRVMDAARQLVAHLPPDRQEDIFWRCATDAYRLGL